MSGVSASPGGHEPERGHGFGTAPVFLASVSTILGAVMFLRFGYSVGHIGVGGTLLVILLGHLVTLPTALAIAEIATNRRVEGGGEYFIISRSFGTTIGGAIGIALFLSQGVSVAFYMIAFAEAFRPLAPWFESVTGLAFDSRFVSVPGLLVLLGLMLTRGARIGVAALWGVAVVLGLSLLLFFVGAPVDDAVAGAAGRPGGADSLAGFAADPFIVVFAIVFPAFTGMTAGVGLSGDLENPRRSIPLGVLSATVVGMLIYAGVVLKLGAAAPREALVSDQLVMSRIAAWGPVIPIGLACATVSSAIGSILVAPRTLQALAADRVIDVPGLTGFLSAGEGPQNEPRNGTLVTAALALVVVLVGGVDSVARIISMFFMVTYGALCAISFLEHFAARPGYRPSFRSKWYVSLFGALASLMLMFQMDPLYAAGSLAAMAGIYLAIERQREHTNDLSTIFHGVMTQLTRKLQVRLQVMPQDDWRPSVIAVSGRTFRRTAPRRVMSWLCRRHGVGTWIHHLAGTLDGSTLEESERTRERLVREFGRARSEIYLDTMVSPSMRTALAQALQMPGVGGMENNTALFELSVHDGPDARTEAREGLAMARTAGMNLLLLRHGDHHFGDRSELHVWLSGTDEQHGSLMVLLAYMFLGHPDWRGAELSIFATSPKRETDEARASLDELSRTGRIPVSPKNVRVIPAGDDIDLERLVEARSGDADLVLLALPERALRPGGETLFSESPQLNEVLWVHAHQEIAID